MSRITPRGNREFRKWCGIADGPRFTKQFLKYARALRRSQREAALDAEAREPMTPDEWAEWAAQP